MAMATVDAPAGAGVAPGARPGASARPLAPVDAPGEMPTEPDSAGRAGAPAPSRSTSRRRRHAHASLGDARRAAWRHAARRSRAASSLLSRVAVIAVWRPASRSAGVT